MADWEKLPDINEPAKGPAAWEALPDVNSADWEKLPDAPANQSTVNPSIPSGTPSAPVPQPAAGQSAKDVAKVKAWAKVTAERGREITHTDESGARVFKAGEYWKDVAQRTGFAPPEKATKEADKVEVPKPSGSLAGDVFEWLKYETKREGAFASQIDQRGPLDKLAGATVGAAARGAERMIGHPAAVLATKLAMRPVGTDWDPMGVAGELHEPTAAEKEFAARTKGTTPGMDVQPGKFTTPSAKELLFRRAMAGSISDDRIKLSPEKEAEGGPNITQATIPEGVPLAGGYELWKVAAAGTEVAGNLTMYALLPTGIGARVTAGKEAAIMAEAEASLTKAALGRASTFDPKKTAAALDAAKRGGLMTEVGVQSAVVGAKQEKNVSEHALEGAAAIGLFDKALSLLTRNYGARKQIMSEVNKLRLQYSLTRGAAEGWADPAILLPAQSWKEFLAQSQARIPKPAPKKMGVEVGTTGQSEVTGSRSAPFTYKTIASSPVGPQEVRVAVDKNGKVKEVYRAPVSKETKNAYLDNPVMFEVTDPVAHAEFVEQLAMPGLKGEYTSYDPGREFGKAGYAAPEQLAKEPFPYLKSQKLLEGDIKREAQDAAFVRYQAAKAKGEESTGPKTTPDRPLSSQGAEVMRLHDDIYVADRAAQENNASFAKEELESLMGLAKKHNVSIDEALAAYEKGGGAVGQLARLRAANTDVESPKLLTFNKKNNVIEVTPMIDNKPSTTSASPRAAQEGDVVHLADGELAVIEKVGPEQATANMRNGQRVEVPKSSVSLADETQLDLKEFVSPNKPRDLLKFKRLSVPRVANATGLPPPQAKALLDDMVAAGQLHPPTGGRWRVKESWKPEAKEGKLPEEGYRVYYGVEQSPGGVAQGKSGILRGRDPEKLGNRLIEVPVEDAELATMPATPLADKQAAALSKYGPPVEAQDIAKRTKIISVPMDDVVPYRPQLGNAAKSRLPQEWGLSHPVPVDVFVLSQASYKEVEEYTSMAGRLAKLLVPTAAVKKGLQKLISHDAFLVPIEHGGRALATKLASQPALVKAHTERYQQSLGEILDTLSVNDVWLSNILGRRATAGKGNLSDQEKGLARFFANNPQIGKEAQDTIRMAAAKLKANEQALAPYIGKIESLEQLRAMGLEEEYMMNVYLKHMMKHKDWARFVKEQMPTEFRKAVEIVARRHPEFGAYNVEDEIMSILGVNETASGIQHATIAPSGDVKRKLIERVQLEKEIRDVLGGLDSASIRMAHSLAATDSMLARINSWNQLATTPYWSPGPRADLGPNGGATVPNHPMFGKAAGGRIHESFEFLTKQRPMREARSIMRTLSSVWKFNQVVGGGLAPWFNQVMRNWKYMVFSDGLQNPADFQTFFEAAELMAKYSGNPIKNSNNLYAHAMNNGGIGTGFAGSEINKNKAARQILEAIRKQNGKAVDMWDLLANVSSSVQGGAESMGSAYDAIDRLFKLTAFINNYRRCLAKGMSADDATAFAVMRNNQSFPNFELVAPKVEQMRQGSVSAVAPFLTSKAEDMRVSGLALWRMKDEPDLVARVVGAGATLGALGALMREERRANGISDNDAKKGLDTQPLSKQAFRPGAVIWPELDSQGRMQVMDTTQWEDFLIMSQMHERDFAPAAIVRNNLNQLWGEATLQGAITDIAANQFFGVTPLSPNQQLIERPGQQSIAQGLFQLALEGAVPQGPIKIGKAMQQSMPFTTIREQVFNEPWTIEQSLIKSMGAPFAGPIGKTTEVARVKELDVNTKRMVQQMWQTAMNTPPEKRDAQWAAQMQAIMEIMEEYNEYESKK